MMVMRSLVRRMVSVSNHDASNQQETFGNPYTECVKLYCDPRAKQTLQSLCPDRDGGSACSWAEQDLTPIYCAHAGGQFAISSIVMQHRNREELHGNVTMPRFLQNKP
jgi:hypothetical protein